MGQSTDRQGLGQVREKAHEQIDKAADELEGAAKAISDQGRQLSENVQEVGQTSVAQQKSRCGMNL